MVYLQVFTKTKHSYKLTDDLDRIASAMVHFEGDVSKECQKPDGFWGKLGYIVDMLIPAFLRKARYMLWHNGRSNIIEKFSNYVAIKMEKNIR